MVECGEEMLISDYPAEDALIVAEEYKGELAGYCYCGAQAETAAVPIVVRSVEHFPGDGVWGV